MAKDPAFLFYSSDFLTGTMLFSSQEKGQYITLLSVIHQQGRLTKEEIEVVLKESASSRVLSKFKQDDSGLFYNERLETETAKRKKFTESRKNSLSITNGDMVHIYLLFDSETANYKIGSSKYPGIRLTDAQKARPHIVLFWKTEGLVERINEKNLHTHFAAKKVIHDWFSLNQQDIDYIVRTFRTDQKTTHRTEARTENENENRNTNELGKDGGRGEEKPLPEYTTWDQEKQNFFDDGGWQIKFSSHKNISIDDLQCQMREFIVDTELRQDFKVKKELQSHFTNLFNKQKNGRTEQRSGPAGKQGTSEARTGTAGKW